MGLPDGATKRFSSDKKVFADIFNFAIYDGEQVIDPSMLKDSDTTEIALPYANGDKPVLIQKYRDVFKVLTAMEDSNAVYALLGVENQTAVNYAMTPRNMLYDALSYADQITRIAKMHRESGDKSSSAEFLSGFHKEDKLKPVITLVIYWGADTWDSAASLHEMLDVKDKALLKFIPDYKITVISPASLGLDDFSKFHSELREVLKYIKYSKNSRDMRKYIAADRSFRSLSREAVDVINALTGSNFEIQDGKESVDMCKALEDLVKESIAEGRAEGEAKGRAEGEAKGRAEGEAKGKKEGIKEIVINMLKKNLPRDMIAELSGFSLDEISAIAAGMKLA